MTLHHQQPQNKHLLALSLHAYRCPLRATQNEKLVTTHDSKYLQMPCLTLNSCS